MSFKEVATTAGGCLMLIVMLSVGLCYLAAGYGGLAHEFAHWVAVVALLLFFFLDFSLPLLVGVFFFVRDVLQWHWAVALLIAAPGLALMIPAVLAAMTAPFRKRTE